MNKEVEINLGLPPNFNKLPENLSLISPFDLGRPLDYHLHIESTMKCKTKVENSWLISNKQTEHDPMKSQRWRSVSVYIWNKQTEKMMRKKESDDKMMEEWKRDRDEKSRLIVYD